MADVYYPTVTGIRYVWGSESPLTLTLGANLSNLPSGATIVAVVSRYKSNYGSLSKVEDNGGETTTKINGQYEIEWSSAAVTAMNDSIPSGEFTVEAAATLAIPFPAEFYTGDPYLQVIYTGT